MDNKARQIHAQAEQARERGDFLNALVLTDQAMVGYQQQGDRFGFAEVNASRFLTLRHLYETTNDTNYLIVAKHTAKASVELAQASGDPTALAVPYHSLGKVQEELGELSAAVDSYQLAVDHQTSHPSQHHNRQAVLEEFKIHLYAAKYKAGDKNALEPLESAIEALGQTDEDTYNKNVWLSGGYMSLAEILKQDNPVKAKEALDQAKQIIDSDLRLTLRRGQWEKLAATFN